jgi:hypothetical protein
MNQEELNRMIAAHEEWWQTRGDAGDNLTLYNTPLSKLDISHQNLRGANLSRCDCQETNFQFANLTSINMTNTDLRGADMSNAILVKTDCRFVQIDSLTNFTNTKAEGMIVDWDTYQILPEHIKIQGLQVTNRDSIEMLFEVRSNLNRDLIVQALNDMTDYLEKENTGLQVHTKREGSQYRVVIDANSASDAEKVRLDIKHFGQVLSGTAKLHNEKDHTILEMRYDNLLSSLKQQEKNELTLKIQYAETKDQLLEAKAQLRKEQESAYIERNKFLDLLSSIGGQITLQAQQRRLIAAPPSLAEKPKSTKHSFATPNKNSRDVVVADIVACLTKPGERAALLYLTTEKEAIEVVFSKFDELAKALVEKNDRLFRCNKGLVINLDFVENRVTLSGNRIQITLRDVIPHNDIYVARDYKSAFDEKMRS